MNRDRIDQGIGYLKAFYGWIFDGITHWIRVLLNAVESVFVGTPWIVTAVMFIVIAQKAAGRGVATFVGLALVYLALFGRRHGLERRANGDADSVS